MTVGREYSPSSYPRYLAKMVRRFVPINITEVAVDSVTPARAGYDNAVIQATTIAKNWVNGFVPYSKLRYEVLPILDKYGINRSMAYMFMAEIQHAYKQLVKKQITTPEEIVDRFINDVYGSTTSQREFWNITPETMANVIKEVLALIGINVEVTIE